MNDGPPPDSRRFQRRIEDFVCAQCGREVTGSGYTNHCPHCLWSRHVDVLPGDRANSCEGMMEPVAVEERKGERRLVHRCTRCGEIRANRVAENDSFEAVLEVVRRATLPPRR